MPLRPGLALAVVGMALSWAPAGAITLGQTNDFQGLFLDGWSTGLNHPVPAVVVPDGGPAGPGDGYLRVTGLGGTGAGSNLVAIAGNDWAGNYALAGVTGLMLDVNNLGATDLVLRVQLLGPTGSVFSSTGTPLPVGSGWQTVLLSLQPQALAGTSPAVVSAALSQAIQLRLVHMVSSAPPNAPVNGVLGINNVMAISAVPEPASWGLMALGGALLAARIRRKTPSLP